MTPIRHCGISIAVLFALVLCGAAPALGATHTWIGPTNGAWSNAANWSGASKPSSGEPGGTIVQFGANTTSSMDIAGLAIDQIHFTGANNTINGTTALTISGSLLVQNIVSEAGGNTLGTTLPVTLTGAALEAASSSGTLTIAGPVGGSVGLVFAGNGGDFALTGNNTYTGPTSILSGALHIATPLGYVIVGSSLTVGDGMGAGAQLVLDQSSDISPGTAVTVNSDGVFNFQSHSDFAKSLTVDGGSVLDASLNMTGPLVVNEGTVAIGGVLSAGSLNMTGGTLSGPGMLGLAGDIQATSSASGPATVASGVRLSGSPTITVTPGTAPELRLTGAIGESGGSRDITKAGGGTLLMSASNTYSGTTSISAGTLLAEGSQSGAFSVGPNGTLSGSGTVGATSVAGVLAPSSPPLHTGALSMGPSGKLNVTLTSLAPGTVPSVSVIGPVAIDPSAALNVGVAPGTSIPGGSTATLIDNDASDAIGGQFAGLPNNALLTTAEGVPLTVSYAGGDGNDLSLTAAPAPSQGGAVAAPASVAAGTPGGGGTSTGGRAKGAGDTSTVKSAGYGAAFGLSAPNACVRPGAAFSVALSVKRLTRGKAKGVTKGKLLAKVTKVAFAIGRKTIKTVRSTPYRARLTVPRASASGATITLRATAYLKLLGGKSATKSLTVAVKVC